MSKWSVWVVLAWLSIGYRWRWRGLGGRVDSLCFFLSADV